MNNHGIICKNNNMIIFIFIIFLFWFLLEQKVKLNIDFSTIGAEYNYCIQLHYLWDLNTFYPEDINKIIEKIKKKTDILKSERSKTNHKKYLKKSKNIFKKYDWVLDYISVDRVNLETKIGLKDDFVTCMVIPFLSTILAIGLQKFLPKTSKQFSIKPVYDKFFFSLKGATYISIKLKDIFLMIFKLKKLKKESKVKSFEY